MGKTCPSAPRMALAHDKFLRPMHNNLKGQIPARYALRSGETWETHSKYPRSLQALKPIPKHLVQRTRLCVMVGSTIPCDLPYDKIVPDVMVVTMPLSRLPETSEVEGQSSRAPLRNHLQNDLSSQT